MCDARRLLSLVLIARVMAKLIGYGYQRNAIALVSRPMKVSELAANQVSVSHNGIGVTLEMFRNAGMSTDYIRGQVLYGLKKVTDKGFRIFKA